MVREDTDLATMTRTNFQKILKIFKESLKKEKVTHLKRFKSLRQLPDEVLHDVVQIMSVKHFSTHQYIYREGQESDYVYFINKGEVELSISREKNAPRVRVALITEKHVFG